MGNKGTAVDNRLDVFVSVVGVLHADVADGAEFLGGLYELLDRSYTNYEIVLVDNGAPAEEITDLRELLDTIPCVRILRLTKHFTPDTAIFAGLEAAIGDYVVVVSPGFDPIDVVPELVKLNLSGVDVVQGISKVSLGGTWFGRLGRTTFYWYNRRYLGIHIPQRATYLTGLTRRAVNSLTRTTRNQRYLRHLLRHIGFRITRFEYTPTAGRSKRRSLKAGSVDAVEMISSYSTHPLRVVTALGVTAGFLNLAYAVYVVVVNFVRDDVAEGWTTTSLQLSLMFFLISIIIAVQSEYIGRVLTESRREPPYVVLEELESETLISDVNRRNVSS